MRSPMLTVSAAVAGELGEQLVREPVAGKGQMLELLNVGQAAGAIVLEDELVSVHHLAARGCLRVREAYRG